MGRGGHDVHPRERWRKVDTMSTARTRDGREDMRDLYLMNKTINVLPDEARLTPTLLPPGTAALGVHVAGARAPDHHIDKNSVCGMPEAREAILARASEKSAQKPDQLPKAAYAPPRSSESLLREVRREACRRYC